MYKYKNCIKCILPYVPRTGNQKYCGNCIKSGIARKLSVKKYDASQKGREKHYEQYYKDIERTKKIKNKYNRSTKGKLSKKKYYLKNKDRIMAKMFLRKKETSSRRMASYWMIKWGIKKICTSCKTTYNITIHHIDGDCFNNKRNNLTYLCRRCHGEEHIKMNTKKYLSSLNSS